MSHTNYKPTIPLYNCNQNIQKSLGPLSCGISRSGGRKRRTLKGGNRCLVPPNPTPSSYWPAPPNPAPPNPVPPPNCQFPHFRPLVLSQFGGKKSKKKSRKSKRKSRKTKRKSKKYKK